MPITDILKRDAVVEQFSAEDRCDAIRKLVDFMFLQGFLTENNHVNVECEAVEREMIMPTGLEEGVAVPHAVVEGLERQMAAFGRADPPVDFIAHDGKPCDLIFLILIPGDEVVPYVQRLSEIVRFFKSEKNRELLRNAQNSDEIYDVFKKGE